MWQPADNTLDPFTILSLSCLKGTCSSGTSQALPQRQSASSLSICGRKLYCTCCHLAVKEFPGRSPKPGSVLEYFGVRITFRDNQSTFATFAQLFDRKLIAVGRWPIGLIHHLCVLFIICIYSKAKR